MILENQRHFLPLEQELVVAPNNKYPTATSVPSDGTTADGGDHRHEQHTSMFVDVLCLLSARVRTAYNSVEGGARCSVAVGGLQLATDHVVIDTSP